MPLALQHAEVGTRGWLDRDVGDHFADYAALMVKHLGDRINFWATVNEPEVIVAGYICDGLAPAYCQPSLGYQAGHNLLLAHGKALQAMRAARANRANQFGIVLNFNEIAPHRQTDMCRAAATRRWETAYAWYLDGLLRAFYPQSVLDRCAANGWDLNVQAGDMAIIAQALDWLGINWYTRFVVNEQGNDVSSDDVPRTLMGWEIDAPAFARTLIKLNGEYRLPPVYITENGAALKDRSRRGIVHDDHRIDYLHQHIRALEQAIVAGVDVRGYSVWSLLDNLEWSLGFSRTFGIVHVNRTNLNRTIKDSGIWYANVIAKHKHRA